MAESDLDKDLAGLMNDIGGGDAPDAGSGLDLDKDLAALKADSPAGSADAGAGGSEEISLDADLQSMMSGSGADLGGEAAPSESAQGPGDAMATAGGAGVPAAQSGPNLDFLLDIKLNVTFEVGRAKMLISDLLTLGQGSVIELHRLVGDELDLLVNGKLVAKGEVVVINEKFGCKIAHIIPPEERIRHMGGF
jgi:flagellar motor switch protein FliN/FliY